MADLSRYRVAARTKIAALLDALPADASLVDAKKALRGQGWPGKSGDGLCWARQCWTREVREALGKRFGIMKDREPCLTVAWNPSLPATVRWRIDVYCPFCGSAHAAMMAREPYHKDAPKGGCIACFSLRSRLLPVVARPEWRAFRKALCDDPAVAGMAADWLEEQGLGEVAEIMRTLPAKATDAPKRARKAAAL